MRRNLVAYLSRVALILLLQLLKHEQQCFIARKFLDLTVLTEGNLTLLKQLQRHTLSWEYWILPLLLYGLFSKGILFERMWSTCLLVFALSRVQCTFFSIKCFSFTELVLWESKNYNNLEPITVCLDHTDYVLSPFIGGTHVKRLFSSLPLPSPFLREKSWGRGWWCSSGVFSKCTFESSS